MLTLNHSHNPVRVDRYYKAGKIVMDVIDPSVVANPDDHVVIEGDESVVEVVKVRFNQDNPGYDVYLR